MDRILSIIEDPQFIRVYLLSAVLSRFPFGDAAMRRLPNFERWREDEGQLRLGGRMAIRAEIKIGEMSWQLCSAHLTSGVWRYFTAHQEQTRAVLDFLEPFAGPTVWGGDLNTGIYYLTMIEPSVNSDHLGVVADISLGG